MISGIHRKSHAASHPLLPRLKLPRPLAVSSHAGSASVEQSPSEPSTLSRLHRSRVPSDHRNQGPSHHRSVTIETSSEPSHHQNQVRSHHRSMAAPTVPTYKCRAIIGAKCRATIGAMFKAIFEPKMIALVVFCPLRSGFRTRYFHSNNLKRVFFNTNSLLLNC